MKPISPPTEADRVRLAKMWLTACQVVEECCSETLDQTLDDIERLQRALDYECLDGLPDLGAPVPGNSAGPDPG